MWSVDYSQYSRLVRWMVALAILVVLPQAARAQWRATVGAQSPQKGKQVLAFLPNELWIHEGDSITWRFEAGEIHTATFLATNPVAQARPLFQDGCPGFSSDPSTFDGSTCVSTPPLVQGATFTVQFPMPGNYKLVCLVHPDMTGVVHVLELSKPLPHTQGFYDEKAEAQTRALLSDAEEDDEQGDSSSHASEHQVIVGGGEISTNTGGASTLSTMRFVRHTTVIHAGQTVEWASDDPEDPHTITFGTEPAGAPLPPSSNVTIDADGARHAVINSTSDSVHSGFILAAPQDRTGLAQSPLGVTRFRITFTHPGTYPYICVLHDDLGMKGKIIVLP
jgi:plastocyanin